MKHSFTGPLFIVGMPRSGTKLLRDLLKQNPKIGIPSAETDFIPYMISRFGNPPNFENNRELDRFYEELRKTTFWGWMEKEDLILRKDDIYQVAKKKSWNSIFTVILKFYSSQKRDEDFIWGDKSITYLCYMKLLKEVFPEAKFVHIIRDPRNCCLSAKKAWGKSLYRTARLWRQRIAIARVDGHQLREDYMEVFYETLLDYPEMVMRSICEFLGCEFTPEMTELSKPSENLGDTKGQARIVKQNKKKYRIELSQSQIRRIEEIVYPVAKSLPYKFEFAVKFKPLSHLMSKILMFYDGLAILKFNIQEKGILKGITYVNHKIKELLIF